MMVSLTKSAAEGGIFYEKNRYFISVHSGRGNFSAELEQSLDMYPFISMAALENVYENSKYLLSQLFYSTIYIGKGVANQHNPQY